MQFDWRFEVWKRCFAPLCFGADERAVLDRDGHIALPGVLTDAACVQLTAALARIQFAATR